MKKPIQLSIANPCHENWDNMTPADKGRFCASCQKRVVDFTRSSDREILEAIKTGGQACGRFRASQLNRDLVAPQEKNRLWATAGAAAMALLTLGVHQAAAQTPSEVEKHQNQEENRDKNEQKKEFERHNREKNEYTHDDFRGSTRAIKGLVLDNMGMPVPSATVKVVGKDKMVHTDFEGVFTIEAKEGDTLEITFLGMVPEEITISQAAEYTVVIHDDPRLLEEIFVGQYDSPHIGVASEFMFGY